MPRVFACPNCQNILQIQEGVVLPILTCPRCLAQVDNPAIAIQSPPPASGAPTLQLEESLRRDCPRCGQAVEPSFRFCPQCNANLRARPRESAPMPDEDVRWDMNLIGSGLVVLAMLGGLGIVFFLCSGAQTNPHGQVRPDIASQAQVAMILSVVLIGAVVTGMVLAARSRTTGSVITGVFGGLTIGFLVLVGFLAWIVFACASFKM